MANKSASINSFRTKDIDAKFEKATKADLRAMTGTGSAMKKTTKKTKKR